MPIIRKVTKHSGSLEVTIPKDIARHLTIERGKYVVWVVDKDSRVVLEKLTPKKHPGYFVQGLGWVGREK